MKQNPNRKLSDILGPFIILFVLIGGGLCAYLLYTSFASERDQPAPAEQTSGSGN